MKSYWANIYVRNGKTQSGLEYGSRKGCVSAARRTLTTGKSDGLTLNSRVRVTLK